MDDSWIYTWMDRDNDGIILGYWWIYPKWSFLTEPANLKKAIDIVDLPINNMMIFHSYLNVYQRVSAWFYEALNFLRGVGSCTPDTKEKQILHMRDCVDIELLIYLSLGHFVLVDPWLRFSRNINPSSPQLVTLGLAKNGVSWAPQWQVEWWKWRCFFFNLGILRHIISDKPRYQSEHMVGSTVVYDFFFQQKNGTSGYGWIESIPNSPKLAMLFTLWWTNI